MRIASMTDVLSKNPSLVVFWLGFKGLNQLRNNQRISGVGTRWESWSVSSSGHFTAGKLWYVFWWAQRRILSYREFNPGRTYLCRIIIIIIIICEEPGTSRLWATRIGAEQTWFAFQSFSSPIAELYRLHLHWLQTTAELRGILAK
jgi:hypothetical protein